MTQTLDHTKTLERLVADRKVRAAASAGSYGTDAQWAGSIPTFVTFERGLLSHQREARAGILVERFPYECLEVWREWEVARDGAPLALLATSRVAYDPTGFFTRIQKMLWTLTPQKLAAHRADLLGAASAALQEARCVQGRPGHGVPEQIQSLVTARGVALTQLYPALLTHLHQWPEYELRLPHAWRATAGLRFPRAVYHLDALYGFGGEQEARAVLLATRGLGLVTQERSARAAFQSGYYDGAVRLLRDEAASAHRADIARWAHLSANRRSRLSTLLGLERSPLGPTALQMTDALLEACRDGE